MINCASILKSDQYVRKTLSRNQDQEKSENFCFSTSHNEKNIKRAEKLCNLMNFLLIFCSCLLCSLHEVSVIDYETISVSITVDIYFSFVSAPQTFYELFSHIFLSFFLIYIDDFIFLLVRTAKNNPGEIFFQHTNVQITSFNCKLSI